MADDVAAGANSARLFDLVGGDLEHGACVGHAGREYACPGRFFDGDFAGFRHSSNIKVCCAGEANGGDVKSGSGKGKTGEGACGQEAGRCDCGCWKPGIVSCSGAARGGLQDYGDHCARWFAARVDWACSARWPGRLERGRQRGECRAGCVAHLVSGARPARFGRC